MVKLSEGKQYEQNIKKALLAFESHLHKKHLKMTSPRREILEKVGIFHDHFDADGLFTELRASGSTVSRATVYRTLELLDEAKLVRKTNFFDQKAFYEFSFGHEHHDHLICMTCGEIIEFHDPIIEKRQDAIVKEHGFHISCHSHKIYGTCPACLKSGKKTL